MTNNPGQCLFISPIDVIYGDQPSQAPSERLRDLNWEGDDINYQYGGKFVWLIPRYTTQRSAAVIGFEMAIQEGADGTLKDLAKGAGGDFCYLLPIKDVTKEAKVTQVALLRLNGSLGQCPAGWSGNTMDINKNRGKTFPYLLWKTAV
ncbi:hypothetical protein LXA43DRAFT_1098442 [Ganoderma leucocontextum]|nr:hypothetical protein LXA43DRAFT_1098442 [Ganoderma leucocontextum]